MRGAAIFFVALTALAYQRPFRSYTPMKGADSEAGFPPDYQNKAEVVLGRLMYPSAGGRGGDEVSDAVATG